MAVQGAAIVDARSLTGARTGQRSSDPLLTGGPWTVSDLTRLAASEVIAAGALGVSWGAVSTTVSWSTQMTWLVVAVGALVVAGWGSARWLLVGFQSVRLRQRLIDERTAVLAQALSPGVGPVDGHHVEHRLVTAAGMRHYHTPTCPLVAGKVVSEASERKRAADRLEPCGVCRP